MSIDHIACSPAASGRGVVHILRTWAGGTVCRRVCFHTRPVGLRKECPPEYCSCAEPCLHRSRETLANWLHPPSSPAIKAPTNCARLPGRAERPNMCWLRLSGVREPGGHSRSPLLMGEQRLTMLITTFNARFISTSLTIRTCRNLQHTLHVYSPRAYRVQETRASKLARRPSSYHTVPSLHDGTSLPECFSLSLFIRCPLQHISLITTDRHTTFVRLSMSSSSLLLNLACYSANCTYT